MNLLFDLDGTLTDPQQGILGCVCYALEQMGVTTPPFEDLRWVIGPPLQGSLATLLGDRENESAACLAHYRDRFSEVGLFENAVYDGVREMLAQLGAPSSNSPEGDHDGRGPNRLFVATSKPTVYSERILNHFQLAGYFERVYGSELDGTRSDKTELIAYLIASESLDPAETVMIGDRKHDIIGAKKNGIRSIGVLYGYGSVGEIEAAGPDLVAASVKEIAPCVERLA